MKIKHVYGNVLKLDIPLTIKIRTMEGDVPTEREEPFYPDAAKGCIVELANNYNRKIEYKATIKDNIVHIEDIGKISIGKYKVTVKCYDADGNPYRYMARDIVEICDATADAGIEAGVEFNAETYTLEGAVFISYVSGSFEQVQADWTEADTHSKAYIKNKPTNLVEDENYVHTDNNYTSEEKEKLADLHNYDDTTVRQLIADTNANFANYYDKQESYSAVEIDTMLRTQRQGRFVISEELPVASADTMFKIYLIPSESAKEANVKDEFITLQNGEDEYSWEQVGSTAVDLSGYSTTEEMNAAISAALSSYYSKTDIDGKLSEISTALGERYTKTEIDAKLANKADKSSVYTKTETDTKLAEKADKASTLAGYGIKDAYTKKNVDALLTNKAGTDVYRQIADVDADRRAAPFGKIISEQIDTEEESYGGDILEDQICYSTVLSTFVYKEIDTTKYYANWPTKKHYTDANGYPYFGKQFYCHDEDKMYYFDGMKLKAVQIPAVVSFFDVVDDDIDIIMGSVAEEDEFPEYEVVFSTVHNRFVYKTDDGKFYDNWSTRYLYVDYRRDDYLNNYPRCDVMYFAHNLSRLYIYDYEMSNTLMPINEDLSDFLKKKDHALTEFITAGQEATVVDYTSIFNGAAGKISKMHWMYFIRIKETVVGIMDVQVSYAGNASRIRITERLRTRALLSNDKKSIVWEPTLEWKEDHEYTRFILSYDDMSQEINAGEWTAWYEVPKLTIAEKQKIGNVYTKTEVDRIAGDKESKMAIVETDSSNTIQAEVGKCYNFSEPVNTLAISLPAPTEKTYISNIMMYFKTGATPAVTITSEETLLYQDGYEIDANTRYELNCLFNGKEWVVAAMKIGEE